MDDNDKLIAQRVVPLDGLQSGKVDHLFLNICYRKCGVINQIQLTRNSMYFIRFPNSKKRVEKCQA